MITENRYLKSALSFSAFCGLLLVVHARLNWLFAKRYPNSTDGFYYLQEFKQRIFSGRPYYTARSVFFSLWSELARLLNLTPVDLYNVIFISSLLFVCIALRIYIDRPVYDWRVLTACFVFLASDLLFYRHYAFLKQGFAMSVFLLGLSFLRKAGRLQLTARRAASVVGIFLLVLASATHILAGIFSLVFLIFLFLPDRRQWLVLIPAAGGITALLLLNYTSRSIFALNSVTEFSWWGTCKILQCSQLEWAEFGAYSALLVLVSCIWLFVKRPAQWRFPVSALILIIILNAPLWTREGDMLQRLAVSSCWLLLVVMAEAVARNRKIPADETAPAQFILIALAIFIAFGYSTFGRKPYAGFKLNPELLENHKKTLKDWIPENAFVLAEHGLQFQVSYFLDRSSAFRLPSGAVTQGKRFYLRKSEGFTTCPGVNELKQAAGAACVSLDETWSIFDLDRPILDAVE